ncbi:hypothetical protein WA171_004611 [Blastocystis sp. BT1]
MSAEKNQLNNTWTLWYECRPETIEEDTEWSSQQKPIASFSTVEDFWCIYNNILPIRKLGSNCKYHYFKEGISPSWEDENNTNGGSWRFAVRPTEWIGEDKWITLLLSVIGESMDPSGESVCGVSVVMKNKGGRIEVWVKNVEDKCVIASIGRRLRSLNVVDKKEKVEFRKHGGEVLYVL